MNSTLKNTVLEFLHKLPFDDASFETKEDPEIKATFFTISTDTPKLVIGKRGETLRALNYLARKIVENKLEQNQSLEDLPNFIIDVDGYHAQKIKDIKMKAKIVADRARSFKRTVELEPMHPYYRLLVHSYLSTQPDISTESVGVGRDRRVTVTYEGGGI